MGELILYQQAFYNPHQDQFREFHLAGLTRRFKQSPKGEIGNVIWDAGFVLSKYLEDHFSHNLKGKNILELGSGTGIAGITAALLGGNVLLTDGSDPVLELLVENVHSIFMDYSHLHVPSVRKLSWGTNSFDLPQEFLPYDYIICADVVYAPEAFLPLVETLRLVCSSNTVILFAYKKRYDVEDQFFALASPYFTFTPEPQSMLHKDYQQADIYVYKVTKI